MTKYKKEIAILWAKGELKGVEVAKKYKTTPNNIYVTLAKALKEIHYEKTTY